MRHYFDNISSNIFLGYSRLLAQLGCETSILALDEAKAIVSDWFCKKFSDMYYSIKEIQTH